jgi:hypothetical protein
MFRHYSLHGIEIALHRIDWLIAKALTAEEAEPLRKARADIKMPEELIGKRRRGMSAKSPYARYRGARKRSTRLARATGPGSYDALKRATRLTRAMGPDGYESRT